MKKIVSLFVISLPLMLSFTSASVFGNYGMEYEEYQLVIITPQRFVSSLQSLVVHKNSFGVKTMIKPLEDIYQYYDGRDQSEQIKFFIKDALETWNISFVLLIGGRAPSLLTEKWLLPVRYSNIIDNWMTPENEYISDLYYADIYDEQGAFCSWDTNNNNIFGEWLANEPADDIVDLYPDIYVGRLPCRTTGEVQIIVDKIITYEKETYASSWFKNMVVVAGDTYTNNDYFEGEEETQQALEHMADFNHIKLWTSDGSFTGFVDVFKAMLTGCGFIYFAGHGSPGAWGTHPPYDKTTWIYGLKLHQIPLLINKEKLPICIVGGCHNSMFNISLFHNSWTYGIPIHECWSWRLTRKIGGGAIATIGCTGLGYGKEDKRNPELGGGGDHLNCLFFKEYGVNKHEYLGEVWGNAISSYVDEYPVDWNQWAFNDTALDAKTVQEWVLIGDPSLKIGGYD